MSFLDNLRRTATKAVDQHGDKISRGLDKAADLVDKRTKGRYSSQIRTGVGKAKQGLDRLDRKSDRDLGGTASGSPTPPGGAAPPGSTRPRSGPKRPPGTGSTPPRGGKTRAGGGRKRVAGGGQGGAGGPTPPTS